jgi:hypothetical protein
MAMSSDETKACHTQHAFLVVWGRFAQAIGLIEKIEAVVTIRTIMYRRY